MKCEGQMEGQSFTLALMHQPNLHALDGEGPLRCIESIPAHTEKPAVTRDRTLDLLAVRQ